MLDLAIKNQLKEVFGKLTDTVTLRVAHSTHADQTELWTMLQDVASVSDKIVLTQDPERPSTEPYFEVLNKSGKAGVAFRGIPGGHEFSSLVLAILNTDKKGKLPDEGIVRRIQAIKGPVRLKTYVSLTCENCPEVVQALNLMAIVHHDFEHETIDGAIAQPEVEALGIKGVPSVVCNGKLLHSGRAQLIDLLDKLESAFGKSLPATEPIETLGLFDVAVVGGGPAGVSAAIYSARKGLKTVLIAERFGGQLQETKGIENMISTIYTEGPKLAAQLSEHLTSYPVKVLEHRRVGQIIDNVTTKHIRLESGEKLDAKAVIIATGAKWRHLGISGEKENIGQGVAFCAHCDGPFYKDKRVAVVGGGNSGVEAAIDLAGIAEHVTLLEYNDQLKADGVLVEKLKGLKNTKVLTQVQAKRVLDDGKKVVGLEIQNRSSNDTSTLSVDGVFVQIGLIPNSQFLKGFVELTSSGEIVVDSRGRTNVSGIYAAGDVTTIPFKQIVIAMGDGAKVALTAFEDRLHGL